MPGNGTSFTVYLPATDEYVQERPKETEQGEVWQGNGMVLVADDEETVRDVAKMMLESIGFEVLTVTNGQEAVDMFADSPGRFAAVLLDITMPELGGVEAYHEMRKVDAKIPIILSSGYNKQEEVEHVPDSHPPVFLKKPYRIESIRSVFRAVLG